jgi:hypothetical protein
MQFQHGTAFSFLRKLSWYVYVPGPQMSNDIMKLQKRGTQNPTQTQLKGEMKNVLHQHHEDHPEEQHRR